MARPAKPRSRRKPHIVSFRLSDDEFERLSASARAASLRLGDFVRVVALSEGKRITLRAPASCDPALLAQLHRIGLNLNQLVKNAHIFGRVSPQVDELCRAIAQLMADATGTGWDAP